MFHIDLDEVPITDDFWTLVVDRNAKDVKLIIMELKDHFGENFEKLNEIDDNDKFVLNTPNCGCGVLTCGASIELYR